MEAGLGAGGAVGGRRDGRRGDAEAQGWRELDGHADDWRGGGCPEWLILCARRAVAAGVGGLCWDAARLRCSFAGELATLLGRLLQRDRAQSGALNLSYRFSSFFMSSLFIYHNPN